MAHCGRYRRQHAICRSVQAVPPKALLYMGSISSLQSDADAYPR